MKKEKIKEIFFRYGILVIVGFFGLNLFYEILKPLTVYIFWFILNLIYGASIIDSSIIIFGVNTAYIDVIPACAAGAAYYLLLILNLTTPMNKNKRIKSIIFLFIVFFLFNITRLVVFAILFKEGYKYFDLAHVIVWYVGSTVMVVAIWFVNAYVFKIKSVPIYSDMKIILSDIKQDKISKKEKWDF